MEICRVYSSCISPQCSWPKQVYVHHTAWAQSSCFSLYTYICYNFSCSSVCLGAFSSNLSCLKLWSLGHAALSVSQAPEVIQEPTWMTIRHLMNLTSISSLSQTRCASVGMSEVVPYLLIVHDQYKLTNEICFTLIVKHLACRQPVWLAFQKAWWIYHSTNQPFCVTKNCPLFLSFTSYPVKVWSPHTYCTSLLRHTSNESPTDGGVQQD